MRRSQSLFLSIVFITSTFLITGCGHKKPAEPQPGGQAGSVSSVPPGGENLGISEAGGEHGPDFGKVDKSQFQADTVYFAYDSAKVRPGEMSKLEQIATALRSSNSKLVVEGYADERGTAEYNRALGERRAQSCREELVRLGIPAGNISTISYGKERPADSGHNEEAWAKNRRCEFGIASQ